MSRWSRTASDSIQTKKEPMLNQRKKQANPNRKPAIGLIKWRVKKLMLSKTWNNKPKSNPKGPTLTKSKKVTSEKISNLHFSILITPSEKMLPLNLIIKNPCSQAPSSLPLFPLKARNHLMNKIRIN